MKNWMQHFVYIQVACGVMQFSGNNFVYLRVFVDILTMPKNILQTNLFENADPHKCDGMTTYRNLVKCNFNKKHGPFLLDILPSGVFLRTSTSSFVVKRLRCKLMVLICLAVSWKTVVTDSDGRNKERKLQYKVVLGGTFCGSLVVQRSTGKCLVQALFVVQSSIGKYLV